MDVLPIVQEVVKVLVIGFVLAIVLAVVNMDARVAPSINLS